MRISLRRIRSSRVAQTAGASYFAFASSAATGFLSIPIAVAFLSKEEIGLWALVNSVVAYLLWMDLGVGSATGRMMADSVAAGDKPEIDRWWTATRFVLVLQAVLVLVVGLACVPLFLGAFTISDDLKDDAQYLLVGSVLVTALTLPLRGVPGLLTAQNRFHWIPLGQAITPWIQLATFFLLLRADFGIRSYVISMAAVHGSTWIYYTVLVRSGEVRPGWSRGGFERSRFRSLFSFSLNVGFLGVIQAVITSLPNLVMARLGGVASVPVYAFSQRGPRQVASLVRRTYHAFYPQLLRLHVTGQKDEFRRKYQMVGNLMLGIGMVAAAFVLAFNKTIVVLLAGTEFYAGHASNVWFSISVLVVPIAALFGSLLQFAGRMGKSALFALAMLVIGAVAATLLYKSFGMPGVASVFAFLPLVYAIYGYSRGARWSGHDPAELSSGVLIRAGVACLALVLSGWLIAVLPEGEFSMVIGTRILLLPGVWHAVLCLAILLSGLVIALLAFRSIRDSKELPSDEEPGVLVGSNKRIGGA